LRGGLLKRKTEENTSFSAFDFDVGGGKAGEQVGIQEEVERQVVEIHSLKMEGVKWKRENDELRLGIQEFEDKLQNKEQEICYLEE